MADLMTALEYRKILFAEERLARIHDFKGEPKALVRRLEAQARTKPSGKSGEIDPVEARRRDAELMSRLSGKKLVKVGRWAGEVKRG